MTNRNPDVEAWFDSYDNPQKDVVGLVRDIILDTDDRITESIKWKAPTFAYRGNIASFFPRAKRNVTLMFHTGASIDDPFGLLEGDGDTSRVARFADADDVVRKQAALRAVVQAWIVAKDR